MTHKEIAEKFQEIEKMAQSQSAWRIADVSRAYANELDPPRPKPGTVVWCPQEQNYGIVRDDGCIEFGRYRRMLSVVGPIKPVSIPAPGYPWQTTCTIPPVEEWPDDSEYCEVAIMFDRHTNSRRVQRVITRAEAERMEAER